MAKESVVLRDDYTALSAIVFIFWRQQYNQLLRIEDELDATAVYPGELAFYNIKR